MLPIFIEVQIWKCKVFQYKTYILQKYFKNTVISSYYVNKCAPVFILTT